MSKLKVKRGRLKGQLSRFATYVDSLQGTEINDQIFHEIQSRLEKVEISFNEFNEIQDKLELTLGEDETAELKERDEFEAKFFKYLGVAKSILTNYSDKESDSIVFRETRQTLPDTQIQSVPRDIHQVKFPAIRLPTFNGEYNKYLEFRDAFNALVHQNTNISNIEKFYYLKSSLQDQALEVVESLEVTNANYNIAWQLIIDRFENKKLIILNHVKAIFEFSKLEKENHLSLRNLYDTLQKNLRALTSLNQPTEHWDTLIIYIASSKLAFITRKEWESYKIQGEIPTMAEFSSFLKDKCEVLEKLEYNLGDQNSKYQMLRSRGNTRQVYTTFKCECYFCKGNHFVYKCDKFLSLPVGARLQEVKNKNLCINCLRPGHKNSECTFSRCRSCNQLHNTLIHFDSSSQPIKRDNNCYKSRNSSQNKNQVFGRGYNQSQVQASSSSTSISSQCDQQVLNRDENQKQGQVSRNSNQIQATQVNSQNRESERQAFDSSSNHDDQSYTMACTSEVSSQVLLATALVLVRDNKGSYHKARALLDNGSQSSFITQNLCNKLGLQQKKAQFTIKGIGQALSNINHQVDLQLKSCSSLFETTINCLVLPTIAGNMPSSSFNRYELEIPPNIKLADPTFNKSAKIDILIGSAIFWNLLSIGQIRLGENKPILQKTVLGWIISGTFNVARQIGHHYRQDSYTESTCCYTRSDQLINDQLSKFWQIEECQVAKPLFTDSERYCESHFLNNVKRDSEGRFIVRMPLKEACQLGESRDMALKRFLSLEHKLDKNNELKQQYVQFLHEYEQMGHMSKVLDQNDQDFNKISYYIPHHAIIRECSLTTKIRVVFDASAKSSNGFSLNDIQFSGPTIQSDLFSILVRFRQFPFVLSADISKMYRQVLIADDQKCLQKIFWRESSEQDIQVYQLNTVTYGTASAPFLAIRCLKQLANENEKAFPDASKVIKNDFYCDDLLTSCKSVKDLIMLQKSISTILSSAGFILRKWLTNKPELIPEFTVSDELDFGVIHVGPDESNKTLGVLWNANLDVLQYAISNVRHDKVTKRMILLVTSQIFDPLGLVGPIIIKAKLILQRLWQVGVSWDEAVPQSIHSEWLKFQENLNALDQIRIPRYALSEGAISIELHGFCDSSEQAYGTCIYIRCADQLGFQSSHLICAKSRVAHLKQVSLPRLELCGANLLAHLATKVLKILTINVSRQYLWSDSTITLGWIKSPARGWNTFVANRVGDIQTLTNPNDWRHVKSCDNPADLLSRGVSSVELLNSDLWWHGPHWLMSAESCWNSLKDSPDTPSLPERRAGSLPSQISLATSSLCCSAVQSQLDIFEKFSLLKKLQRVTAFCKRFANNARLKAEQRQTGFLTNYELSNALNTLIKISQIQSFPSEYKLLIEGKTINKNNRLSSLDIFLENDIIRVGGRLKNSEYNFDKKHPMVLSSSHKLAYLILAHEHERLFHCGPQHLLASVREQFWPLSGRSLARKITRTCVTCFKAKPTSENYKMGDLPQVRVTNFQAFLNVGIDFAGPILLRDRKLRNPKNIKAYLAVFVCMSTKAIHLDLVTDLTTQAFLAVLKRFIYRRGKPSNIYTDNGTTFIGANTQLRELYRFLETSRAPIADFLSSDGIAWHFIPPRSPNFGGLWEAGVKSTKYHLKRVVGNLHLTYENMMTVLVQIEGILNSCPLTPLSSDPSEFTPLTPAHFLIGKSLTSIPEPDLIAVPSNRLNIFRQQQHVVHMFWSRWHREYISELQSRLKWKNNAVSMLKIGSLVLVKDENLPPLKWQLGRVTTIHPGKDNVVRVASVRLPNGSEVKRVLSKLCVLPVESTA